MPTQMTREEDFQMIAEGISHVRDDDPVVQIRPELNYIDVEGKLGKMSTAMVYEQTAYIMIAANSDIDALDEGVTRVWFGKVEELASFLE